MDGKWRLIEGCKNNSIREEIMFNLLREKMKYDSLIICKVDKGQTEFTMDADDYVELQPNMS